MTHNLYDTVEEMMERFTHSLTGNIGVAKAMAEINSINPRYAGGIVFTTAEIRAALQLTYQPGEEEAAVCGMGEDGNSADDET